MLVDGRKKAVVDVSSCAFVSESNAPPLIEREHIVPVSVFAKGLQCWEEPICTKKNGKSYRGRQCCLKSDPSFKKMYYDKKNIRNVIGELNRKRRDYPFAGTFDSENKSGCYILVNKKDKTVAVSDTIQNEIKTIYEYMKSEYALDIIIPFEQTNK